MRSTRTPTRGASRLGGRRLSCYVSRQMEICGIRPPEIEAAHNSNAHRWRGALWWRSRCGIAICGLMSFVLLIVMALPAFGNDEILPEGTIKKGTLANAKLVADAKLGVAAKVGTMGCAKPERLELYVVAMPTGVPGQRQWKELWLVSGCNSKFPVHIDFRESGPDAADWTIRK